MWAKLLGFRNRTEYLRHLIIEGIRRDLKHLAGRCLVARPGFPLFQLKPDGETVVPLTETLGGERVWILESFVLPVGASPYGQDAYLVDVVAQRKGEGVEARAVIIPGVALLPE